MSTSNMNFSLKMQIENSYKMSSDIINNTEFVGLFARVAYIDFSLVCEV